MRSSYREALDLLEQGRAQLRPVPTPSDPGETAAWLRRLHPLEIRAADAACEEFALMHTWPEIRTDGIVTQLNLRVTSAIGLCRGMIEVPVPQGLNLRQLLRLMLMDYWHGRVARWRGDGAGGGLEPVAP